MRTQRHRYVHIRFVIAWAGDAKTNGTTAAAKVSAAIPVRAFNGLSVMIFLRRLWKILALTTSLPRSRRLRNADQLRRRERYRQNSSRLVGEGGHQLDLLVGERPHRGAQKRDDADWGTLSQERDTEHGSKPRKLDGLGPGIFRVRQDVGDVNHLAFERSSACERSSTQRNRILFLVFDELAGKSMTGGKMKKIAPALKNECKIGLAQRHRRLHERVEHGLQVEGRSADDLEHVGGRGLLLQGFAKISRALAQFV